MNANGQVHKYGDNVDTDVIIPARYLNTADHKELAAHCMEDIDKDFVKKVSTKYYPPDLSAINMLLTNKETDLKSLTDDELEEEKQNILKLLKELESGN